MPNTIKTNSLATLVAVRAAENAPYLTVGSKKYFKDQLIGKRNGQTYKFVIADTGEAVNTLAKGAGDKITITEREVALTLDPWHVMIETNAIEKVTDIDWDPEIAKPNAAKLMNACVKKIVNADVKKAVSAFVGSGFAPLSRAGAHLKDITNDNIYGFVDSNIEAILTSNGQQFVPVDAPDMYSKGLLGKFHEVEYRSQRFFPSVTITSGLATDLNGAKVTGSADNTTYWTLTISNTSFTNNVPAGTPLFIKDIMACDTVGDETANLAVFIVLEDATPSSNSVQVKVSPRVIGSTSTREICNKGGTGIVAVADIDDTTPDVFGPDAGTYFMGLLRAEGAEEFESLDKLDAAGADYEKVGFAGLNIHQNRLVDLEAMTNFTRWDIVTLAGLVDGRASALVFVK